MAILTEFLNDLTSNPREVRDLSEVIVDPAFNDSNLGENLTVVEGIKGGKQVIFGRRSEKVVRADAGCGDPSQSFTPDADEKFWDPKRLEVPLIMCYTELEGSFMQWLTGNGLKMADITGTEVMRFIVDLLKDAIAEDVHRLSWFGDTAYVAGDLGNGASDLPFYTPVDGLWKQIIAAKGATPDVDIPANASASKALQTSDLYDTPADAYQILRDLSEAADTRIWNMNPEFLVTRTIYNLYHRYLVENSQLESARSILENGKMNLTYDGIPLKIVDKWDRTIKADFDDGTTWDSPHRAILTPKSNLMVGFDSEAATMDLDIYYDRRTKEVIIRSLFRMDTMLGDAKWLTAAY